MHGPYLLTGDVSFQRKMSSDGKFQFAIDRGGTFTDVWARCPGGKIRVLKLLSEDPQSYPDAPREGIRRILEQVRDVHSDDTRVQQEKVEKSTRTRKIFFEKIFQVWEKFWCNCRYLWESSSKTCSKQFGVFPKYFSFLHS